jgi:hypothetical protein
MLQYILAPQIQELNTASHAEFRAGLVLIFLQNDTVANVVVIWQLVSNHGLTRLKKFVSSISSKLYN